jgi:nucleoid DNA-binding protein
MTDSKQMTVVELRQLVSDAAGITVAQATAALNKLSEVAAEQVKTAGVFTVPNVCRITRVDKPATEAGVKISPFTKKEVEVKAKPAYSVVKVKALKAIKDAVK